MLTILFNKKMLSFLLAIGLLASSVGSAKTGICNLINYKLNSLAAHKAYNDRVIFLNKAKAEIDQLELDDLRYFLDKILHRHNDAAEVLNLRKELQKSWNALLDKYYSSDKSLYLHSDDSYHLRKGQSCPQNTTQQNYSQRTMLVFSILTVLSEDENKLMKQEYKKIITKVLQIAEEYWKSVKRDIKSLEDEYDKHKGDDPTVTHSYPCGLRGDDPTVTHSYPCGLRGDDCFARVD